MTDDERTEPGRGARRSGRPRQPGPPPPWPGEESSVPNVPAGRPAPRGNGQSPVGYGQSGYGQSGAGRAGPGQSGAGQSGPGQSGAGQSGPSQNGPGQIGTGPSGPRKIPPGRPQQALPPGRHAGQDSADRAPGSYQGSRRNVPPNGTPAGYAGRPDATQPGVTPGRPQDRTDPLTDPSYALRPGTGLARSPQPRRGGPGPDDTRRPGTPPAGYGNGTRGYEAGGNGSPRL